MLDFTPPKANKIPFEITRHGHTRIDPYYWLGDRTRKDEKVLNHLRAENNYTHQVMAHTEALQSELFEELKGRLKQTDESVPYLYEGYYYYTRYEEGKEYPIYCRKAENGTEQIMLDCNVLAQGQVFHQVGGTSISTNNHLLAYTEDLVSRRIYRLRIRDLRTGTDLADEIEGVEASCVWANDNKSLFYVRKDPETLRACRVFRHVVGTPVSADVEVYFEEDESFHVGISKSKSKQWLMIESSATLSDECRLLNADEPMGEWKVFEPRQDGLEYSLYHHGDEFLILTNADNSENFQLMKTPVGATGRANWQIVLEHRTHTLIEDLEVFDEHLVLTEKSGGSTHIRVISQHTGLEHYVSFDEEVYHVRTGVNPDFDARTLRIVYQSMTTPLSVFEYHMTTKKRTLLKQQEILGGFEPKNYKTQRLWATARDGERIPMSLVHRTDVELCDKTPLLLYGYGAYGITIDPYFSPARLSLLDRGFVFVIAHIRGGQMMGRAWYDAGRTIHKMNSFNDFIDCAEYLISRGYTSAAHLYAMGGSAGGLLMGGVINMRPDLWRGVVAAVPFVDVLTTMLDPTIPLTTGEYDEWGNPEYASDYNQILEYSPYDNVKNQDYPNLLVTTGLHDSQVQYWEPAKWVQKLRDHNTGNNLCLLLTNLEFGHSGASGRFEMFKEIALEYAFFLWLEGKHNASTTETNNRLEHA